MTRIIRTFVSSGPAPEPLVPFYDTISLRQGLDITLARQTCPSGLRVGFEIDEGPVSLSFSLSQPIRTIIKGPKKEISLERGTDDCLLACLPGIRGVTEAPAGRFSGVSIHVARPVLFEMFSKLPDRLKPLHTGGHGEPSPFYRISPMGWEARLALGQILDCPYAGDARTLFLEAKALELLALNLSDPGQRGAGDHGSLSRQDLERAREAHHILLTRMEDPPGLQELSVLAGLNRNKLNRGFKQLYGGTVFSVLRDARLTMAMTLVRETRTSLVDIALSVGYSDQANFSNAFRRRFGFSPKILRTAK